MNYSFINFKGRALSFALAFALMSAGFNLTASAQYKSADNLETSGGELTVVASYPLGKPNSAFVPQAVDPNSIYSNVTTFRGDAVLNTGATNIGGNTITRLVADNLTFTRGVPVNIFQYRFSVANGNGVPVSFRPRVRFYADNAGVPGALLGGNTFGALTIPAGTVSIVTTAVFVTPITLTSQNIWAGITFDNNLGATGATAAQLDALGQGSYHPPDRGTSADSAFRTTAAGDFFAANPAGAPFTTAGVVDNFGWELITAPPSAAPVSVGGRVTRADGSGIAKASVTVTDSSGTPRNAFTNGFGYYRFDNIPAGETYIFNASSKRYTFTQKALFVSESTDEVNFVAEQ